MYLFLCACLPAHMYGRRVYALCPQRSEEGSRISAAGALDGYRLPCVCQEQNLGPLEEEQMLLTTQPFLRTEPEGWGWVFVCLFVFHCFQLAKFLKRDGLKSGRIGSNSDVPGYKLTCLKARPPSKSSSIFPCRKQSN